VEFPPNRLRPKTLYGANAFEISDIQEQETETSRIRPLQCYIALKLATRINSPGTGAHFFNGSPVLASTLLADSIYTKTQPIQWAPENFGGDRSCPGRRVH